MVDRFGTSRPVFAYLPKPQPQSIISGNTHDYTTSLAFLPPVDTKLASLQPSGIPVYESAWLDDTDLAVTTQINDELGKCTTSQSNTRSRSYGNKQYHVLQYYSFWFS